MTALLGIHPEMLVLPLMYAGIGFLFAALVAVALSPAIHRRAERLTKRRLKENVPQTAQDLQAAKDHLRAQHAVETRDLTLGMEKLQEKAALQSAELGRRTEEAHRLRQDLDKKDAALAKLERHAGGFNDADEELRAELSLAQFEAKAGRVALREAEQAIMTLQDDIAELTAAVESRSRLIDRQQHDIMALTAQIDRISKTQPVIPAPIAAQAMALKQKPAQPVMAAAIAAPPARATTPAPVMAAAQPRTPGMVSFESRLASIRDDKPLRDVRPQAIAKRAVVIEPAPQIAKAVTPQIAKPQVEKPQAVTPQAVKAEVAKPQEIAKQPIVAKPNPAPAKPAAAATPPAPKPAAASAEAEPARVSTDIRYDEPLSTADLLELGKAMLRQPATGVPHKTH